MRRSRTSQSQQKTLSLFDEADFAQSRVKPEGAQGGLRDGPAQDKEAIRETTRTRLLEQVVAQNNMRSALRRVERNKGAAGVDGMTAKKLRPYLMTHWRSLKQSLLDGSYRPSPVKRVEIPKPGGGVRLLGIPTVVDRLIQQALLQVLTPLFDPHFSGASYGFRPERRGMMRFARRVSMYATAGDGWWTLTWRGSSIRSTTISSCPAWLAR